MPPKFSPILGAQGFQQSNPSVLAIASLLGSLQIFKEAGMMRPLRQRSLKLTAALEDFIVKSKYFVPLHQVAKRYPPHRNGKDDSPEKPGFTIITPREPESRGAQLSLLFLPTGTGLMRQVFTALSSRGVIGDEREPDVIRLTPAPLYNSIKDCERAALYLDDAFDTLFVDKL
jgi:kynureninase